MHKNKSKHLTGRKAKRRRSLTVTRESSATVKAITLLVASIQSLQTTIENKRCAVEASYIEVGDIITDGGRYVEASFRSPAGVNGWRVVCRKTDRKDLRKPS